MIVGMGILRTWLWIVTIGTALASPADGQSRGASPDPQAVLDQAVDHFLSGNIDESATAFDDLVDLVPDFAPRLWQRGIVLYYAGRYDDCRQQFESHRTVNPNDVENAAWHFLCVAREHTAEEARSALLPVGPDGRVPMREIYQLFAGSGSREDVMAATGGELRAEFYAHLYLGLYEEAIGNFDTALDHIRAAAADEYARAGGYMHTVARVHLEMPQDHGR